MRNSWPLNNMSSNCIDPLSCWFFFSVNMTTVLHDLVSWILRCRTTDIKLYLNFNCTELAPLTWTLFKGQLYMKDWKLLKKKKKNQNLSFSRDSLRTTDLIPGFQTVNPWSMSGFSSVQLLSCVRLFTTPWITNSQSPPKPMSIKSVMPSNHLILCCPLLLLPSIFPSIRVFSNESVLLIRWPKYWSFSFNISPSNEHPGLISFRMDWLDLLAVQGTLKSLLQHPLISHEINLCRYQHK